MRGRVSNPMKAQLCRFLGTSADTNSKTVEVQEWSAQRRFPGRVIVEESRREPSKPQTSGDAGTPSGPTALA